MRHSLPFLLAVWIAVSASAAEAPVGTATTPAEEEAAPPIKLPDEITRLHRRLDFLEKVARESHQALVEMETELAHEGGILLALSTLVLISTLATLVVSVGGFAKMGGLQLSRAAKGASELPEESATPARPVVVRWSGTSEEAGTGSQGDGSPREEPVSIMAPESSTAIPRSSRATSASGVLDESDDMMRSLAALPHGRVAMLLHRLRREGPKLAEKLANPRMRERFHQELLEPLPGRVLRFIDACEKGEAAVRDHWVEPDLLTALDTLGRCLSEAIQEGRNGHPDAMQLAEELKIWLYRRFDKVCRDEGWFGISAVLPYQTRFDPAVHHAVGGREVREATGLVISVQSIGLIHPREETLQRKAEVIVGR